jgi:hypothetical protein
MNFHAVTDDKNNYTKDEFCRELEPVFYVYEVLYENFIRRFHCNIWERRYFQTNSCKRELYEIRNNTGFRVLHFATLKNLIGKC